MKWVYNKLQDYSHISDELFNKIFFLYGNAAFNISNEMQKLYETNSVARYLINIFNYSIKYVSSMYLNQKIEPMAESWISISAFISHNNWSHDYKEYYSDHLLNSNDETLENRIPLYEDIYNSFNNLLSTLSTHINSVVTLKHDNIYIHRICNKSVPALTLDINDIKKSYVRFLSIEYTHPDIKDQIIFTLDKSHFLNNNEILSNAFVLKLLEYQSYDYVFDNYYKLKIMDNNINTFEISSNQHILLKENSYHIVNNK
jgi:hypothetical protein